MDGHMPNGKEAADIVQEAIEDLLTGKRSWDPVVQPDLFVHLRSIVDSKLSHLVESAENQHVYSDATLTAEDDRGQKGSFLARLPNTDSSLPDALVKAEEERQAEEFFWGFHTFLANEPLLQQVIECIFDGDDKPTEMANRLGVAPKDMYHIRKKLQRRLTDYHNLRGRESLPGKGGPTHG
jgi:hypothetical protein